MNHPESATFTANGSLGPIANVLSRVTGGGASSIDGLLRSTIPDANLFFINPHGVFLGPNAKLDVPGSFHVSTADYLRLGDGVRFEVDPSGNDALLTTAPPATFGFLSDKPAGISVQGSALELKEGETLSFVGGDFDFVGTGLDSEGQPTSFLFAPGGRINLASVASSGEVSLGPTGLGMHGFTQLGQITLSHNGFIATDGPGGGRIFIRGGRLVADSAFISANTLGDRDGEGIDINIAGELKLDNDARIRAVTDDQGSAGDIIIKAGKLAHNGVRISASTFGPGRGGDVQVEAADILLSADGSEFFTGITAQAISRSTGAAGNVTVKADKLVVRNGAEISAFTHGAGHGGDVRIEASDMLLSGDGSEFFTGIGAEGGPGKAGNITVKAGKLAVRNGAQIFSGTEGKRRGGDVRMEAADILLSGDGAKEIRSPDTDVSAGLLALPAHFVDAAAVLMKPCAERYAADAIRLIVRKYEVLPDSPYALRVYLPSTGSDPAMSSVCLTCPATAGPMVPSVLLAPRGKDLGGAASRSQESAPSRGPG
ncbi:MAG: filamentous hemagglutinin N-terminal domain-containing protein [Gammaproteobacteria bacterium]